jgi:hypothetical protein
MITCHSRHQADNIGAENSRRRHLLLRHTALLINQIDLLIDGGPKVRYQASNG